MKKKIFMMLCASLFATSTFAQNSVPTGIHQPSDIPELTCYTDPVIETTLTGDDVPL